MFSTSQTISESGMGKKVAIEDRAVYRVQTYLTKKEHVTLEKLATKKKVSLSAFVAVIIQEALARV